MKRTTVQSLQQYYCNLFAMLWSEILIDRTRPQPLWPNMHKLEPRIHAAFMRFDGELRKNATALLNEYSFLRPVTASHWSEALGVLDLTNFVNGL